ncbi:uncharacterized protein [Leptinotarsa decemlineata]|uniref:uncharacterized protein n=1 Tax=Leptinotarsa decemlineata TaxID=7539 RepID=UPI003D30B2B0
MNYGLTYQMLRTLAYDYALKLERNIPNSWVANKTAGIDWIQGFMRRHTELSLRKPENTSISRATSFHKANVDTFYDNYSRALQKYSFLPNRIYNLDETGVLRVVQAPNVITKKGVKQVGQAVSGERGTLVTMVGIISASGNTIPPVFIFPRARFHDTFMNGAPPGSLGLVNSPSSGWMTAQLFLKTLEHIVNHTKCTKQDPILIVMDNHESHCSLEGILYARDNGIVIVTFPPHCSLRLQPLDVSVYGPFKGKYKIASNDWMIAHPGKTITIHNIVELAGKAFQNLFTMNNIVSGFRRTGIYPLNRNTFTDEDFDASAITDRPPTVDVHKSSKQLTNSSLPQQNEELPSTSSGVTENHTFEPPSTSSCGAVELSVPTIHNQDSEFSNFPSVISPDSVRPYPKAPLRNEKYRGRKRGRSKILTETPEKEALELEIREKIIDQQKKRKVIKKVFDGGSDTLLKQKRKNITKQVVNNEETSSESETFSIHDDSDGPFSEENIESESDDEVEYKNLSLNDYVLVKFYTKKTVVHYVGLIKEKIGYSTLEVQFLRKKGQQFHFPLIDDTSIVEIGDIVRKLQPPSNANGTERTSSLLYFKFNHSQYNIR